MAFVETQWWLMELPDEWEASQEDDAVVIADQDGVGELLISTLQRESGTVTDEELREYAGDAIARSGEAEMVAVADTVGLYCCYADQGEHLREWYLRCDDLFLYVTYCCDSENAGLDDAAIDEILATLQFRLPDSDD